MLMKLYALMKKIEVKSLVSGDKAGRLLLEFNIYNDQIIDHLNRLMKADEEVKILIVAKNEEL